MSDTDTTTVESTEDDIPDATPDEGGVSNAAPEGSDLKSEQDSGDATENEPETFPREVVEKLRKENARYRDRAKTAEVYAKRLHAELVRATGRLADPTDLEFDEDHIADADKMVAAIDDLLERKPHLASRKPSGDIGQGQRGSSSQSFSLLDMLKERT